MRVWHCGVAVSEVEGRRLYLILVCRCRVCDTARRFARHGAASVTKCAARPGTVPLHRNPCDIHIVMRPGLATANISQLAPSPIHTIHTPMDQLAVG